MSSDASDSDILKANYEKSVEEAIQRRHFIPTPLFTSLNILYIASSVGRCKSSLRT